MRDATTTEVRLSHYIDRNGVQPDCFSVHRTHADDAPLQPDRVRYRVLAFGLNSGMANRMGAGDSASGNSMEIGEVPKSEAVLRVTESESPEHPVGRIALWRWAPWRDAGSVGAQELLPISDDGQGLDPVTHLTLLGHVGFTAYVGLFTVGRLTPDDTIFISAGAGGVGSCAVQFAKARGARVIACAGSDRKVELLRDLGADVALNYKAAPLTDQLADGELSFNVYLDLVGGKPLEAAIEEIAQGGRIVICGTASQYSSSDANTGIPNYPRMIYKELSMKGFSSPLHEDVLPDFNGTVGGWLRNGRLRPVATVREGMEQLPRAFADMIGGANTGRMVVTVASGDA